MIIVEMLLQSVVKLGLNIKEFILGWIYSKRIFSI